MDYGIIFAVLALLVIIKISQDISSLKNGENTGFLIRIILLATFLCFLFIVFIFVFLVNYIKKLIDSTESVVSVTETTELMDNSESEKPLTENNLSNNIQLEGLSRGRTKKKVVRTTRTRSTSREVCDSTTSLVNNLKSAFSVVNKKNDGKKMEMESKVGEDVKK